MKRRIISDETFADPTVEGVMRDVDSRDTVGIHLAVLDFVDELFRVRAEIVSVDSMALSRLREREHRAKVGILACMAVAGIDLFGRSYCFAHDDGGQICLTLLHNDLCVWDAPYDRYPME